MQAGTRFTYTTKGWKAELISVLLIYRDGLPLRRQPPIHVLTGDSDPTWSRTNDLAIASPTS